VNPYSQSSDNHKAWRFPKHLHISGFRLLIRVDADSKIGSGHVMRCLALAQACKDAEGKATLVSANMLPNLVDRIRAEGIDFHYLNVAPGTKGDAHLTSQLVQSFSADWAVIDGYHFSSTYQQELKKEGTCTLVLDDDGRAAHYFADVVLNQNLHASKRLYTRREPYTKLLLGSRYVLLRREFLGVKRRRIIRKTVKRVLVTLGGGDAGNRTTTVVRALRSLKERSDLEIKIVMAACSPHVEPVEKLCHDIFGSRSTVETGVRDMASLMEWADVAISAGGITVWELASMGVPAIVGTIAPVEELLVNGLRKRGLFLPVGPFARLTERRLMQALSSYMSSYSLRKHMSETGQRLVDGEGCARTLNHLIEFTRKGEQFDHLA
jgi:UDP-2,4-diacetamido-2,4,6-trideoxy-beta-L-altropyranose hydrolase